MTNQTQGTIYDRYEIGDPACGAEHYRSKRGEAFAVARVHQSVNGCPNVTVFDRMAHKGRPHEWDLNGPILCWRDRRCEHEAI